MNGIERLRAIAGAWDEWGLGGSLTEIADEIERELVRHDEPDSTDNGTRLLYVTDEDRETLEWVREQGGLGAVQARVDTLQDTLDWLRGRAGVSKYEIVDYGELLDSLDRRLMPEGCIWPHFDDGEPVMFGDEFMKRGGVRNVVHSVEVGTDWFEVYGFDGTYSRYSKGERVRRPAVPAADGEPLEVRQTVWDVESGEELKVEKLCDVGLVQLLTRDGASRYVYPDQLTHTKPEPPDSWERIEDDATLSPEVYCHRNGIDISQKDGTEIFLADTVEPMARDLVRRAKTLAEKENRNE